MRICQRLFDDVYNVCTYLVILCLGSEIYFVLVQVGTICIYIYILGTYFVCVYLYTRAMLGTRWS